MVNCRPSLPAGAVPIGPRYNGSGPTAGRWRTAITLAIRIRNGLYLRACHSDTRATRSHVNASSAESVLTYRDSKTATNGRETRRHWIISGIMVTTFAMSAFAQQADKSTPANRTGCGHIRRLQQTPRCRDRRPLYKRWHAGLTDGQDRQDQAARNRAEPSGSF